MHYQVKLGFYVFPNFKIIHKLISNCLESISRFVTQNRLKSPFYSIPNLKTYLIGRFCQDLKTFTVIQFSKIFKLLILFQYILFGKNIEISSKIHLHFKHSHPSNFLTVWAQNLKTILFMFIYQNCTITTLNSQFL